MLLSCSRTSDSGHTPKVVNLSLLTLLAKFQAAKLSHLASGCHVGVGCAPEREECT
jgi:hypothetical protein